jgi:hypothetical protein
VDVLIFYVFLFFILFLFYLHRKSKLTETKKDETCEEQSQEHAHNFLCHQRGCSQRIRPGRPKSQFCILLWYFIAIMKICEDFALNVGGKRTGCLIMATTISHFLFHQKCGILYDNKS